MVRTDYHTHTPLCQHAQGKPGTFAARAIELGLHTYGISDHCPMPPKQEPFDDWRMYASDLPAYREWIEQVRIAAPGLEVLAGLECDWLPGIDPWIRSLEKEYNWDYLIGSVHYLSSLGSVDDSVFSHRCLSDSVEKDWQLYWQAVIDMVKSELFDIVGHIDLVKIWGHVPDGDLMRFYEPALNVLEDSGMAVEINTAGWHKHCAEQYPAAPLLQELLHRHIPIVIDSDAHAPEHLSRDWEKGISLLKELTGNTLHQYRIPAPRHPNTKLYVYGSL